MVKVNGKKARQINAQDCSHRRVQLLYKYHEGYILNSIAQYPMHMKERERKCHRAEFEGTENY